MNSLERTVGNKPRPVCQKNSNTKGICLTMTRSLSFTDSTAEDRGRRRRSKTSDISAELLWVRVCMQVVLYPWVHESSLIKCQPVISIFCCLASLVLTLLMWLVSYGIKQRHFLLVFKHSSDRLDFHRFTHPFNYLLLFFKRTRCSRERIHTHEREENVRLKNATVRLMALRIVK